MDLTHFSFHLFFHFIEVENTFILFNFLFRMVCLLFLNQKSNLNLLKLLNGFINFFGLKVIEVSNKQQEV